MYEHRLTRIAALALVLGAVAAPTATARPADMAGGSAIAEQRQDLRNPDRREPAPTSSLAGTTAIRPSQDLRSPDAVDAAAGRGTFSAPDVVVVPRPEPRPVVDGIDWRDVGIGAGGLVGLTLIGLGGALAVVHRRHARPAIRS